MWLLVVYWVIGLLGYWVIGLLGYWVIGLLRTGGFAREFWLWSMFWEDLTGGGGVLLTFRPGYSHLTWVV